MKSKILWPKFPPGGGLIPAIAINSYAFGTLMLAWVNDEAFRKTLETGWATYFSRSRQKLWVKGEESGNLQQVVDVYIDCDGDAVIYRVIPRGEGVACHTNAQTCFYRSVIHGDLMPAPKAGKKERLELVEVDLHPDLRKPGYKFL